MLFKDVGAHIRPLISQEEPSSDKANLSEISPGNLANQNE